MSLLNNFKHFVIIYVLSGNLSHVQRVNDNMHVKCKMAFLCVACSLLFRINLDVQNSMWIPIHTKHQIFEMLTHASYQWLNVSPFCVYISSVINELCQKQCVLLAQQYVEQCFLIIPFAFVCKWRCLLSVQLTPYTIFYNNRLPYRCYDYQICVHFGCMCWTMLNSAL